MKKKYGLTAILLTAFLSLGLFLHAGRKNHCCTVKIKATAPAVTESVTATVDLGPVLPSVILF